MPLFRSVLSFLLLSNALTLAQAPAPVKPFPFPEKLSYRIEWRLVTAGNAVLQISPTGQDWQTDLHLESAGLVSRLFRVLDTYRVVGNEHFCLQNSALEAQEGKRHNTTAMTLDNTRRKLLFNEKDLVKNTSDKHELDVAPCTYEISGALQALRELKIEPGKAVTFVITNGKKLVNAKVEAHAAEKIIANGKNYSAIRYEAFVFDNVLYRRKGRLFVWMTDDTERLPVQFQFQMGFPIGNVTLELEKQEKF
jgi:Protein of unknown function (DUF3108)